MLHYDLIAVSFILSFVDGSSKEYFTDFLLCVSKNQEDATNIQNMLQELIAFDDSQVGEWIFSDGKRGASNSLYEGKWNKRAYKSLSSYIQLLEQVIACYKNNFAYFRMQGKHTIKQSSVLVPYEKVKKVSRDSFNWIMQNADQLANVPYSSGVQYQGKNYLPYHLKTDASQKSWDVYENRITATLYYQPVISAFNFENGLTLYRTTSKKGYYTPDFVLKFSFSEHDEEYIIFDAKFASRDTIKNFRLPEVIRKYSCELCVAANSRAPKMVWILQGRVNSNEKAIWRYHNSPLVSVCRPATSFGIVSVNTTIEIRQRLWNEIKSNILLLQ